MVAYESVPEFINILITNEIVEMVANKLSGSAGVSGFDFAALKDLLLVQDSHRLKIVFAKFTEWMSNDLFPWATYRALMSCQKMALGKDPVGIRPIGIGNILWCQAMAECVLKVAGPLSMSECSADQL